MSFEIVIQSEAILDIQEAFEWYEEQESGLGFEFIEEIESGYLYIILQSMSGSEGCE